MTTPTLAGYLDTPADQFDWRDHLNRHDPRLLNTPDGRRILTRLDPLLFALIYFPHHLRSDATGGKISFSQFHLDLCRYARQMARRNLQPAEMRSAWVAPRDSGKTTWIFLILPAWALAHRHRRFVAAFADSGPQAQQHLSSFKDELNNNLLLRTDHPKLCKPATRLSGVTVADTQSLYQAASGVSFLAKGIDASTLGAKIGNTRPDWLLFDDIEPDEANYSEYQKGKRLGTVINAVFPMNNTAVVTIAGTVTMPGSIIHDLVRTARGEDDAPDWPTQEKIETRHYLALYDDPTTGQQRSVWPQRWPLEYLLEIAHTRSFALNFQNLPVGVGAGYWEPDLFTYGMPEAPITRTVLFVDPTVTTKTRSDPAGLVVVGYAPPTPTGRHDSRNRPIYTRPQCVVLHAEEAKLVGEPLRQRVLLRLEQYPEVDTVVVEANQGGENWHAILHDLPVRLVLVTATQKKETRAADLLHYYQVRPPQVTHARKLAALEQQMCVFPKGRHDDILDAVGGAALRFLGAPRKPRRDTTVYPR